MLLNYGCNDQSETFRLIIAKNAGVFDTRLQQTEYLFLANSLVRDNKVQMCVWVCK